MPETNNINVDILDDLIIGRVEPQIYAFTTETIPNYLKVGDTYRPIENPFLVTLIKNMVLYQIRKDKFEFSMMVPLFKEVRLLHFLHS